jgi:hypothetical protein
MSFQGVMSRGEFVTGEDQPSSAATQTRSLPLAWVNVTMEAIGQYHGQYLHVAFLQIAGHLF